MEDHDESNGRTWRAISIFGVLIVVGAAIALWLFPKVMQSDTGELVIIAAPTNEFKTKPVDAGGKKIANQDSAVMEMLGDLAPEKDNVETLVPPSDAPELPAIAIEDESKLGAKSTEKASETASKTEPSANTIVAAPKPEPKPEPKPKPKPTKTEDTTKASASVTKKKIVVDGTEPAYMVQIAAFRSPDIAAEQAGLLAKKHEKRLQGVSMGTMRIDTGENGIFWRIVSEPLPRAAADKICAGLKRAGQDCILRKFISPAQ